MVGRVGLDRPLERGPEVVGVGREALGPLELCPAPQVRPGLLDARDVVLGVGASHGGGVTACLEPFRRVLADGLE